MAEISAAPQRVMRADARRNYERLLQIAHEVFAADGLDASLDAIARRANVGIGTLYRHFPTRQDLLEAVFQEQMEQLHKDAEELKTAANPAQALTTWLHAYMLYNITYRTLAASVMLTALNEDRFNVPCAAMRAAGAALLARAQATGDIRGDVTMSDLLRLISGVAFATEKLSDRREQAERLLGLILDSLHC